MLSGGEWCDCGGVIVVVVECRDRGRWRVNGGGEERTGGGEGEDRNESGRWGRCRMKEGSDGLSTSIIK